MDREGKLDLSLEHQIPPFNALHRYYIWAGRMYEHFKEVTRDFAVVREGGEPKAFWLRKMLGSDDTGNRPTAEKQRERMTGASMEVALYMSYFYGALFVVIEGYQELGLHDDELDNLLASPHVATLKRYRNGVFHFQKDYYDSRFLEFVIGAEGSAKWIQSLYSAFDRYFMAEIVRRKT